MADVWRRYGREYLERYGPDLRPSHRRALDDLVHCRTEAWGGQLWPCDPCGQEHDVDHSCRHRSCPKCHGNETAAWLEERRQELLPGPYGHVVFPRPPELRALVRRHQQDRDDLVLRAAAQALITRAADPHEVGGLIGVLGVLHTWTRALVYHPHVHGLVPAGGSSADRPAWRPARQTSRVPVRALSKLCRGLFLDLVRRARPDLAIPESVWTMEWVVSCKPAVHGTAPVLRSWGRYVHRSALTNSRMLSLDNGQVCFRYQVAQDQRWKTMTLPARAFIRRFLPHVFPQGFHKVRDDGRWSPAPRPLWPQLQLCLAGQAPPSPPESPEGESHAHDAEYPPLQAGRIGPHGGQGLLVLIRLLPCHGRAPP